MGSGAFSVFKNFALIKNRAETIFVSALLSFCLRSGNRDRISRLHFKIQFFHRPDHFWRDAVN